MQIKGNEYGFSMLSTLIAFGIMTTGLVIFMELLNSERKASRAMTASQYGDDLQGALEGVVIDAVRHFVNEQKCNGTPSAGNYSLDHLLIDARLAHHSSLLSPAATAWGLYDPWKVSQSHQAMLKRCNTYTGTVDPDSTKANYCFWLGFDNAGSYLLDKERKISNESFANASRERFSVVEVGIRFVDLLDRSTAPCGEVVFSDTGGFEIFYGLYWEKVVSQTRKILRKKYRVIYAGK